MMRMILMMKMVMIMIKMIMLMMMRMVMMMMQMPEERLWMAIKPDKKVTDSCFTTTPVFSCSKFVPIYALLFG